MQPTIEQWRSNEQLVRIAREVVKSPAWGRMRDVMLANRPSGIIPYGATATDAGNALGQLRGYLQCMEVIDLLAEPVKTETLPEATFAEENNEDEHSS